MDFDIFCLTINPHFHFLQAQVGSNMKGVDERFISKRNRRSSFQSQEGIMKIYLLRVIQFKMNLSRLEVFHTNIIVIMFFMRELLVPFMPRYIWPVNRLFVFTFSPSLLAIFSRFTQTEGLFTG